MVLFLLNLIFYGRISVDQSPIKLIRSNSQQSLCPDLSTEAFPLRNRLMEWAY